MDRNTPAMYTIPHGELKRVAISIRSQKNQIHTMNFANIKFRKTCDSGIAANTPSDRQNILPDMLY